MHANAMTFEARLAADHVRRANNHGSEFGRWHFGSGTHSGKLTERQVVTKVFWAHRKSLFVLGRRPNSDPFSTTPTRISIIGISRPLQRDERFIQPKHPKYLNNPTYFVRNQVQSG